MARWKDQFDAHPVHQTLIKITVQIDSKREIRSQEAIAEKRRLLKVVEQFERALDRVDPETLPANLLDSLNRTLESDGILGQIQTFVSDDAVNFLVSANEQISEHALPYLVQLQAVARITGREKPLRSLETFADETTALIHGQTDRWQSQLDSVNQQYGELEGRIQTLSNVVETVRHSAATNNESMTKQFSEDQSKWREEFSKEI